MVNNDTNDCTIKSFNYSPKRTTIGRVHRAPGLVLSTVPSHFTKLITTAWQSGRDQGIGGWPHSFCSTVQTYASTHIRFSPLLVLAASAGVRSTISNRTGDGHRGVDDCLRPGVLARAGRLVTVVDHFRPDTGELACSIDGSKQSFRTGEMGNVERVGGRPFFILIANNLT